MSEIVTFANLLHKHQRLDAPAVRKFIAKHKGDKALMARIEVLEKLFAMKRNVHAEVAAALKKG